MKWQAVFFDFDGVILDSVGVKTKAFAGMFSMYGAEVEEKVVAYHLEHGGISRFEKFRYYYKEILHKHISEKELAQLGETFSALVLKGVLDSPFIDGAVASLEKLIELNIPAYIVSGTPQEEIEYIAERKHTGQFFKEIHGSPRKKSEIIKQILMDKGYENGKCLFIGDAISDYNAARETGTCFLGIVGRNESSPFPDGTKISHSVTINVT